MLRLDSKSVIDGPAGVTLYVSPGAEVDAAELARPDIEIYELLHDELPPALDAPAIWLAPASRFGEVGEDISPVLSSLQLPECLNLVLLADERQTHLSEAADELVYGFILSSTPQHLRLRQVRKALEKVRLSFEQGRLLQTVGRSARQRKELNSIGIALSAEHDIDRLLAMILEKARQLTNADAGSLYLIESDEAGGQRLRFKVSQNYSYDLDYTEFTLPLSPQSLAGYTGVTGETLRLDDVYRLPEGLPYHFDRSWDGKTGYRTKSMLVVPIAYHREDEDTRAKVGVLQLINRKPRYDLALGTAELLEEHVIPFSEECEELVESLASQAAVTLENQLLLRNNQFLLNSISSIFEGFLMGWVKAVEDRDKATAGHSQRVTALTLALARAINRTTTGPYADVYFTEAQLRELRYAGLLHDIGKIYVRPEVFLKAKKLYEHNLRIIEERFHAVRRTLEADYQRRKLETMLANPHADYQKMFATLDHELRHELELIDSYFDTILKANEPSVLDEDHHAQLQAIAEDTYQDLAGGTRRLLEPDELRLLSIRRGTLTGNERNEIEAHVAWSYRILSRIPWSGDLANIPSIAGAHHEKLDGSGYPNGLTADEIPLQAKLMTIADIYDALTAADRPYKKAVSAQRALRILELERDEGHVCGELLRLFMADKVYRFAHADDIEQLIDRLVDEDVDLDRPAAPVPLRLVADVAG